MMRVSERGLSHLKREEGCRLRAYRDSIGVWTIGVGHTGLVNDSSIKAGMYITQEKADQLLRQDIAVFERAVNRLVTVHLTQYQFDALIGLVFNIGEGAFSQSTLLKKLNSGQYDEASNEFLRWKNAGGRPLLLNRRRREKAMFDGE